MKVKCLSVRQPYANAILTGQKDEEFRSRRTHIRGFIAIHASRTLEPQAFGDYPNFSADKVKVGVILGLVEIVGCEIDVYGGFAWQLANPVWLAEPIPCKGKVGFFPVEIDDSLLPAELLAAQ